MRSKIINGLLFVEVFSKTRRDPRTGKVYHAKPGKVYHFLVPVEKSA